MAHMTVEYYEQVKDYLHQHINQYINLYRYGNIIDLPPYRGCNRLNKNGTRKEIEYNLGYQCVIPTYKRYWKETKDKYKRRNFYWTRYMTRTNCRHLFKNKGNFIFNYKLKKYEHFCETSMCFNCYSLLEIKKGLFKYALK